MSITSNIANVASALSSGSNIPNLNADFLDGQSGSYYTDFSNTAITNAQSAQDTANYCANVDVTQNTRISTTEANTIYLLGALNSTNSNIVSANTQLKSYTDGATAYLSGVDITQNTRLTGVENTTVYLQGALNQTNTNITNANTQLKAYTDGQIASANNQLKAYVDGQVSYVATVNNTQNTNITTATNLAQGAYDTANLKFNTSGGNITGPVTISSNLTITGNLTVSGNVTTVSANNLILKDNMIYLNDGSQVANPDLGIAGNYNDGTYRHTGFFRDASDGYWKVYDQYLPEPDASPYIDTSNSSFRIADFQANNVTLGKITTSSSQLVTNLNADLLDGQHGSYYAVASEQNGVNATQNTSITNTQTWLDANIAYLSGVNIAQNNNITNANTQLKSYTDGAITSANTQLKSYVDGYISYASGVNTAQNTNTTGATTLAQAAYNQANTDYTTVVAVAGDYGNATITPVIKLAANGRITSITNTSISFPVTSVGGAGVTGAVSNTQLLASIVSVDGTGSGLDADLLDGQHGSYYAPNSSLSNYLPLSGGTLTGKVVQSSLGFQAPYVSVLYNRINGGFFQTNNASTANGWPQTATYYHLLTSSHDNDANYYSMQFAGNFYDSANLYYRATNNNGNTAWNKIWHSGNDGAGSGLDADLLDGQHASYYAVDSVQTGINATQNTNITAATTLAQAAYNQANTDYTTVAPTAGTYGGTTSLPVVTVSANGRITAISNTTISAGATVTDDTSSNATRYVMLGQATSGTYTVANTSSTKLTYNPSTGTLTATALSGNFGGAITGSSGGYFGGTTYTKAAAATSSGNLSFDNGTTDTPGIHFYYGNATNFGIDVSSSTLRFVSNLDETTGAVKASLDASGNFISAGNITAYGSPSDLRLKENVVKLENCLDIVKKLNGYGFNYKGDTNKMIGVVAQEVEEVLPELIYEFTNFEQEKYKAVRYENMVAVLIEAIKDQQNQIDELRQQLNSK